MSPSRSLLRRLTISTLIISSAACGRVGVRETDMAVPSKIVINEVQAGAQGDNGREFIELFNNGGELIDLEGWSLVYRLPTGDEDLQVINWEGTALVPPYGHFLLVRSGNDFGVIPDGFFNQALNTSGGGLALRNQAGETVDSVGWGKAPLEITEGSAAGELIDDHSLTRIREDESRKVNDQDDNFVDFRLEPEPSPTNVTGTRNAADSAAPAIEIFAPQEIQPGSVFNYTIRVTNPGKVAIEGWIIELRLPASLENIRLPAGWKQEGSLMAWPLAVLEPGDEISTQVEAQAPWTYGTLIVQNTLGRSVDGSTIRIAPALRSEITGGVVPINIARTLIDQLVTIEGTATMYTDGFYAGSSGTKFYLDDGSAGVQVYVPDGKGAVNVPVGARVSVEGTVTLYRGALEVIPATPDSVVILESDSGQQVQALPVSIPQAINDFETLPGKLVEIVGTLIRSEEFSYSYELDLVDQDGQVLTAYIDKQTQANIEALQVGQSYRVSGIMEVRDGDNLINPRTSEDMVRIYQPIVYLEADAPGAVEPGEAFTVTLSVTNHTAGQLTDLMLWADAPVGLLEVSNNGSLEEGRLIWPVPQLPARGGHVEVQFQLRMPASAGSYTLEAYGLSGTPTSEISPVRVFNGGVVPIWAIQGTGSDSPYLLDELTTTGVVTGVFPDLGGFWIQNPAGDGNPASSEGLLVTMLDLPPGLAPGAQLRATGQVREISGQTQLYVDSVDATSVKTQGMALPDPIALDPPSDAVEAAQYYEALEGMLVTIDEPATVIGPTSKYGETYAVLSRHGIDRIMRGGITGSILIFDDGSEIVHYDQTTMPYALAIGDQVYTVTGPLAYTFGAFKIEPVEPLQVLVAPPALPSIPVTELPSFSVMTWNVENLFDILEPHPNDPPRPRKAEYELSLAKIASTITSAGAPTVIGLQEIENLKVLQDLAGHELLAKYAYSAYLIEGTDSRGIDVGYLVRGDMAEVRAVEQRPAPEGLTSRPPLILHLSIKTGTGSDEIFVLNNHFTSLAGGIEATEPRRNAQALWNVRVMQELLLEHPDAQVIVLGDLNSFTDSLPIQSLRQAGLHHVFDLDPEKTWYSYVYQGVSQTLDHILVSPGLFGLLKDTVVLHTNADYPPPPAGDSSPLHSSDHDPLIAVFGP